MNVVNINSKSTLHFPVEFSSENREVYLEGEAFFDVVREDKFPFKVHTGDKTITVLGTKFNVSHCDDQEWMATLVQGKISVTARDFQQVLCCHPSSCASIRKLGRLQ
ncbi:MAG: FecR family protein [Butyricimonas faecihominis]